ncbi:hypothetical protein ACRAWF_01115 [Streptomyces sp. L7]
MLFDPVDQLVRDVMDGSQMSPQPRRAPQLRQQPDHAVRHAQQWRVDGTGHRPRQEKATAIAASGWPPRCRRRV